ncbi:MAG: polysaccharide export protein [Elusimicrobia bacterium]|nr:polysaccharide export protein [Elusimicrobiota bacterium]
MKPTRLFALLTLAALLASCQATTPPAQAPGQAPSATGSASAPTQPAGGDEDPAVQAALKQVKAAQSADYRISPTDLVDITVFQQEDLTRKIRVTQNGTVALPLIGVVKIGGLSVDQASALLAEKYKEFVINPQVSIFINEYAQRKIYVMGEVKSPGSFDLPVEAKLTVIEAITLAGGFTPIAAPDRTKVVRVRDGQNQSFAIEVSAITKRGEKDKDITLEPNDVVVVPQSYF